MWVCVESIRTLTFHMQEFLRLNYYYWLFLVPNTRSKPSFSVVMQRFLESAWLKLVHNIEPRGNVLLYFQTLTQCFIRALCLECLSKFCCCQHHFLPVTITWHIDTVPSYFLIMAVYSVVKLVPLAVPYKYTITLKLWLSTSFYEAL